MAADTPLIALIDDDATFVNLIAEFLGDEGYRTAILCAGQGAMASLRSIRPDLIMLDLRMETWDGGERVLEELAVAPTLQTIPVLICSADTRYLSDHATELSAFGDILPKPFDLDVLLDKITALLDGHGPDRERGTL